MSAAPNDDWIMLDSTGERTNLALHSLASMKIERTDSKQKAIPLTQIEFTLNGESRVVSNPDPEMLLVDYLRTVEGLTGTKKSCGEGGCGACTVLLSRTSADQALPINSCLRLLCSVNGQHVITIEGVGSQTNGFHQVQTKLAQCNGSQCGFCSPGMVMSMVGLLQSNSHPSAKEVESQFDGNICRCTGYRPILDAMQSFASPITATSTSTSTSTSASTSCTSASSGGRCANGGNTKEDCKNCTNKHSEHDHHHHHHDKGKQQQQQQQQQQRGCCGDLEDLCRPLTRSVVGMKARVHRRLGGGDVTWYVTESLNDLFNLMLALPADSFRLVAANTASQGVEKYYNGKAYGKAVAIPSTFINILNVPELTAMSVSGAGITVGACTTLSHLIDLLEANASISTTYAPVASHLRKIASHPVRNAGTIGGNLMLAHTYPAFVSDAMLLVTAVGALVFVAAPTDNSPVKLTVPEFCNTDMKGKVLVGVFFPAYTNLTFRTFKIMLRHQNTHAIVNAAFGAILDANSIVQDAIVCYGGIKPTGVVRASGTEQLLVGRNITDQTTLTAALGQVVAEVVPDPVFGRTEYRKNLVPALLYKFMLYLQPSLPDTLQSAAKDFERPVSSGTWSVSGAEDPSEFPVSQPIPKISALLQTSGEARYTDDIPPSTSHAFGAFVLTSRANATIVQVDYSVALAVSGVISHLDAAALVQAGYDTVFYEEPLFLTLGTQCSHVGDRVALILADTQAHADYAATLVKVTYGDEQNLILDLDTAIAAKAFYTDNPTGPATLIAGNAKQALSSADVVVQGTARCGHQYHFYMETQTADASAANGKVVVRAAVQAPRQLQQTIATLLKKQANTIEVVMDRAGGAYGGKYSRSFPTAIAAAVASCVLNSPVRIVLNLNTNMTMLGSRRPHRMDYVVGAMRDGTITAVTGNIYNLQGARTDLSEWDPFPGHDGLDNAYRIPNWNVQGISCRSNTPGNTWCRGPGFLPATYMIENIIEHVADVLGMSSDDVRAKNMYQKNDVTPQGQTLAYCTQQETFALAMQTADYASLKQSVVQFNASNMYVKQGVTVVPTKYYMPNSFGYAATVTVNDDGSVLVQQSGCESGQGLDTKVAQMAALTLKCDMSKITIDKVTSTVSTLPTGGSITSEGCCGSVRLACEQLFKQVAIVRAELRGRLSRDPEWMELVAECATQNVRMQASATYNGQGEPGLPAASPWGPFQYASYGAAVLHVQLDVLTGEVQVLRSDVVLDCGISLNPAIDAGQIQGAFAMGMGYMLTEEFLWDKDGSATAVTGMNISNGTWEYKPLSTTDIPITFNITMLPHAPNPMGVLSSKATGEPSILASVGLLSALRRAINAFVSSQDCTNNDNSRSSIVSKKQRVNALQDRVTLDAPATVEALQMACHVDYTKFSLTA